MQAEIIWMNYEAVVTVLWPGFTFLIAILLRYTSKQTNYKLLMTINSYIAFVHGILACVSELCELDCNDTYIVFHGTLQHL